MAARVFGHFGLKVLSIGLAVALWYMIAGQRQAERSLRVPLEYQNIPEQLELMGDPPGTVDVRVKGGSGTLGQLRTGDLVALVDLRNARPGRRLFHVTPEHVTAPTGIRVVHVQPATVALTFEASVTKTVPVVPAIDGDPAPGYLVGRVSASPATVDVVGPESVVRQLTEATTEPVSLRGATRLVRDTVTIGLADPAARLQTPRSAVVTVEILPMPVDRVITDVPVILRNLTRGRRAQASPRAVTVSARGPKANVQGVKATDLPVYVDLSGLRAGRYNLPVRVDPVANLSITAIEPDSINVRIQ
jgi:YbbR domain-containing protein